MRLAANFDSEEWDCHSGETPPTVYVPNMIKLAQEVLQPIRDAWAAPLVIVSGYRTREWNQKVGGASESTHLTCEGVDVRTVHLKDVARLHDLFLSTYQAGNLPALGGLGSYLRWVHVDSRRIPGRLRRWKGKGVGSEPIV